MRIGLTIYMLLVLFCTDVLAWGSKPKEPAYHKIDLAVLDAALPAPYSQQALAETYAPNSNATALQQDSRIKDCFGKLATWEIIIAEVQPELPDVFRIQGSSDATRVGTFVYLNIRSEDEKKRVHALQRGDTLRVRGIINDMALRHIILNPAVIER